ncbi:MAG: CBU_0592 family membrane protein [Thiohalocapsa sp.]
MQSDLPDIAGFAGVLVLFAAYFANQQRWLHSEDWRFPAANLCGSALILVSLCFAWNAPAAAIEITWALISLWGLIKGWRQRRRG